MVLVVVVGGGGVVVGKKSRGWVQAAVEAILPSVVVGGNGLSAGLLLAMVGIGAHTWFGVCAVLTEFAKGWFVLVTEQGM